MEICPRSRIGSTRSFSEKIKILIHPAVIATKRQHVFSSKIKLIVGLDCFIEFRGIALVNAGNSSLKTSISIAEIGTENFLRQ